MSVTIRDVAKAAGTSTATVSKVLNDIHGISEATRHRVYQAVKALHYEPNDRARSFALKKTRNIIFLTELRQNVAFDNPHMFEIMAGVVSALAQKGYTLTLKHTTAKDAPSCLEEIYQRKQADGVILHAAIVSKKLIAMLSKLAIAHLVIGQPNMESTVCWMDTNNYLSGALAARHLLEKGYRRIAFVGGKPDDMISWHRLRGARTVLEEHGDETEKLIVKQGDSTFESGLKATKTLLRLSGRPDALICANNPIALGCLQALRDQHIAIPEGMAVITFDSFPFSTVTSPMLTVVDINMFDMGKQAGRFIIEKIRKPNLQVQSYTTLPELIARAST